MGWQNLPTAVTITGGRSRKKWLNCRDNRKKDRHLRGWLTNKFIDALSFLTAQRMLKRHPQQTKRNCKSIAAVYIRRLTKQRVLYHSINHVDFSLYIHKVTWSHKRTGPKFHHPNSRRNKIRKYEKRLWRWERARPNVVYGNISRWMWNWNLSRDGWWWWTASCAATLLL